MAQTRLVPFLGRLDEMQRLSDLTGILGGTLNHVLLGGDAGVGKSRLIAELSAAAGERGWQVLTGHCLDFGESALPYLPFSEIFGSLASEQVDLARSVLEASPAIARLMPAHRLLSEVDRHEAPTDRAALLEAVNETLAEIGRRAPLLVVIEDLHWADRSTRELLGFVFSRQLRAPVTVVASYRSDDLHRRHPLRSSLAAWSRLEGVARMQLAPLADGPMQALAKALHPDRLGDGETRQLLDRAEGNPFFLEELLAASMSCGGELPEDLANLMLLRLDQLSHGARGAVRAAAVAGRRSSHELLACASGLTGPALDEALREAVDANVLTMGGTESYAFRHALLAEVVYQDLLPGERARLHAAYARALDAGEAAGTAAELARHARASHDLQTALSASIRAGDEAMAVGGPDEAAQHYELALELSSDPALALALGPEGLGDRVELVMRASAATAAAGHFFRAIALAEDELRSLPEDAGPCRRARLLVALVRAVLPTDSQVDAVAAASEALRLVTVEPGDALTAEVLALHARACSDRGRYDEAARSAREALELATKLGLAAVIGDVSTTLAHLERRSGDPETAEAALIGIIEQARAAGEVATELRSLSNLASHYLEIGRLQASLETARKGWERAVEVGRPWSPHGLAARTLTGVAAFMVGDWELASRAADVVGESPPGIAQALLAAMALEIAAGRGRRSARDDSTEDEADHLRQWWEKDGLIAVTSTGAMIELRGQRGDVAGARGVHDDAVKTVAAVWRTGDFQARIRLAAQLLGQCASAVDRSSVVERTELVAMADELVQAVGAVAEQAALMGRFGPESKAWLARLRAEDARLRWLGGIDPLPEEELLSRWREAVAGFEELGHVYETARSRARLAAVLRAGGHADEASAEAVLARNVAERLGAQPLLDELRRMGDLRRQGERGRSAVRGGVQQDPTALTAREAEVLELVALGRSNRDIAQQLFISVKTVSVHVSNVLSKLNASGRTEAVSLARRRGLLVGDSD